MDEYICTRCRLREPGRHDCDDRACTCCFGEPGPLDDSAVLTREILGHPGALAEIREARAEIERGERIRGTAAVRALRERAETEA